MVSSTSVVVSRLSFSTVVPAILYWWFLGPVTYSIVIAFRVSYYIVIAVIVSYLIVVAFTVSLSTAVTSAASNFSVLNASDLYGHLASRASYSTVVTTEAS